MGNKDKHLKFRMISDTLKEDRNLDGNIINELLLNISGIQGNLCQLEFDLCQLELVDLVGKLEEDRPTRTCSPCKTTI